MRRLHYLYLLPVVLAAKQVPLTASKHDRIGAMPAIGFGTWNLVVSASNTTDAVSAAIEAGYRHIDGAKAYRNQEAVGKGIAAGLEKTGIKREDVWITSKLFNDKHDDVEAALNQTLKELDLDYLDLYLMHWPVGQYGKEGPWVWDYVSTWAAMENLLELGTVRHIGIANFAPREVSRLLLTARVKPYNHQFELHPYLQQKPWLEWHKTRDILVTGYSPFANTNPIYDGRSVVDDDKSDALSDTAEVDSGSANELPGRPNTWPSPPSLLETDEMKFIATKHGATTAQIALAWGMERGYAVIPKSSHVDFIEENLGAINFIGKLDGEDHKTITLLSDKHLHRFNNPAKTWNKKLFIGLDGH